ncbi:sodium-independent sulfate anion transporter isoform X3 [Megachile rotundata]|uniref:sodium-independent sulfate anion transporter isoform X3 n=1 Tax=Megachile rotundata TaxID=143995 RepID=UPI003FD297B4
MFSNTRDALREKMARCDINRYAKRRLPILSWLTTYKLPWLPQDALAGFTVGLTAIPQGIAYGVVAGLSPEYGLYASFMASFVYIVFGSCKSITIGPTAIMATMVQPLVVAYGPDIAVLLTFLKGCMIALLGLFHLGFLLSFISLPVITGFTAAASINIAASQFKSLLGIPGRSEDLVDALDAIFSNLEKIRYQDTLLGVVTIAVLVLFKTPFVLTGTLGEGLPPFGPPPFSIIANNRTYDFIETTTAMGTTLFFVPVVSAIEHMAIAKAFAMGKSLDATQEMLALGLCNMFGSFVRSMPVTGSFTRTAVNHSSGVKTTFGGLFTGCLVLLASSLLTSTFRFIPKATLAAVIICAMYYMLDFKTYALLWRARKVDFFLMLITFLFCVFLKLEWGILIGIVLNLVILLYFSTRFTVQTEVEQTGDKALIRVTPEETIAFPAAEDFRARIMKLSENNSSNVVLDCKNLKRIDVTVAKNLKLLSNDLQLRGRAINCVNCRDNVEVVLKAIAPDTQSGPSGDQNLYH